jgi:hypothetical protein
LQYISWAFSSKTTQGNLSYPWVLKCSRSFLPIILFNSNQMQVFVNRLLSL